MALASLFEFLNKIRVRRLKPVPGSIYDFKKKLLNGQVVDFQELRGKKILIVNTASKCGYTPQLRHLQKLHERFPTQLEILGFPSNDFLWQEPGNNADIESFCQLNYGVTFRMFEKVSVTGKNMDNLFQWLAGRTSKIPSWNFCKYLIDERGNVIGFFPSKVSPLDHKIINKIA